MKVQSSLLVLAVAACAACSDSPASAPTAPSGVFVRTDPSTSGKIWLAFDGSNGARKTVTTSGGRDVVGRTCFTYVASGTTVKMTLKKSSSTSNGATTTADLGDRIVETTAAMAADGSKLDADKVLEDGRFEYTRDAATSASDVMDGC